MNAVQSALYREDVVVLPAFGGAKLTKLHSVREKKDDVTIA